jgi:hypothetical protein
MGFGPTCAILGCGGLGIYRCGICQRTYCSRHAAIVSGPSAHGVAGPWRVRCVACRMSLPLEPPWWDAPTDEAMPAAREYSRKPNEGRWRGRKG